MQTEQDPQRLLATFLDTTLQLTSELDIGAVLARIVERSMELTEADYGAAVTLTTDGEIESFQYRGMTPEQVAKLPHLPEGRGLLGLVLEERVPIRLERLGDHPASVGFPNRHVPMEGFLGVPMQHREQLVGALYLTKSPGRPPFTEADESFFVSMGAMATVGVQNARMYVTETERAERSTLLRDIASKVRRSLDIEEVLSTTVEALGRAAGVERCFIRLADPAVPGMLGPIEHEWDAPGVRALRDDPDAQFPIGNLTMRTRTTEWSDDVESDERLTDPALRGDASDLLANDTRASLATPLEWGDELMGIITFHSVLPRKWSSADVALIEAAAREVAVGLHHARLYEEAVHTADRLRELDQMRSDFVSMVSHELRSPMTVVGGIADILRKRLTQLTDAQRTELIETLSRESRRLTRLVSDVLDLEALDQSGMELQLSDVDLGQIARLSVTDAGVASQATLTVEPGDARVTADPDKVKQVVLNLLSNAAKFSDEGSPVAVSVTPEEDTVRVSVADRGPGMTEEQQGHLFQRFSRVGTGGHVTGSGLGLYLSRQIVETHGGVIWVDSKPGTGSTFSFRLPRSGPA